MLSADVDHVVETGAETYENQESRDGSDKLFAPRVEGAQQDSADGEKSSDQSDHTIA